MLCSTGSLEPASDAKNQPTPANTSSRPKRRCVPSDQAYSPTAIGVRMIRACRSASESLVRKVARQGDGRSRTRQNARRPPPWPPRPRVPIGRTSCAGGNRFGLEATARPRPVACRGEPNDVPPGPAPGAESLTTSGLSSNQTLVLDGVRLIPQRWAIWSTRYRPQPPSPPSPARAPNSLAGLGSVTSTLTRPGHQRTSVLSDCSGPTPPWRTALVTSSVVSSRMSSRIAAGIELSPASSARLASNGASTPPLSSNTRLSPSLACGPSTLSVLRGR